MKMMKVLLVELEYNYGVIEKGPNQIFKLGFLSAFKKIVSDVHLFYYDKYLNDLKTLQNQLLQESDKVQPDLIFFCIFGDHFEVSTLINLKNKFTTMNWFGDDQWRFNSFTKNYAKYFTYCVTTDHFSVSKYQEMGIDNVILSQWAAFDDFHDFKHEHENEHAYKYDVSFIGAYHPHRKWIIDKLRKIGLDAICYGPGWENGACTVEEMKKIFSSSKINLNLANSTSFDLRYLMTSYRNIINTYRSPKSDSQIKARHFEISYYGGFQLSYYVPFLETYFEIGNEITCYSNVEEIIKLVEYFLINQDQRESIRKRGMNRARREHLYYHRIDSIFSKLKK